MANVQRVAIVDPSDDSRESLRSILLNVDSIWLDAECSRYEFFQDVIQQHPPDVALISLDSDTDKALQIIQTCSQQFPTLDIIVVSSRTDGQFILQTIRRGAKEFLGYPVQYEELLGALERLRSGRAGKDGDGRAECKVFAFTGSRGGAGTTSLAVNVGCILGQNPANQVALVDLDLAMGDADVCLDIVADYTLADVALNIDRIDLQLLKRSLSKHSTGLSLLPHPVQIDDAAMIQSDHVARVISLLKMTFTHVLLDLSKAYNPIDFTAMSLANEIVMVSQLDVSSLRNVVRIMLTLGEKQGLDQRVKIVANRVGSTENEISISRAEETIGRTVFAKIPNDSRTMIASRNNGIPLLHHAPKSKLFHSIHFLAENLAGSEGVAEKPKERGGVFSFFQR